MKFFFGVLLIIMWAVSFGNKLPIPIHVECDYVPGLPDDPMHCRTGSVCSGAGYENHCFANFEGMVNFNRFGVFEVLSGVTGCNRLGPWMCNFVCDGGTWKGIGNNKFEFDSRGYKCVRKLNPR